jgi:uncharacterized protein (DUF58 family)
MSEQASYRELLQRWPLMLATLLLLFGWLFGASFVVYAGFSIGAVFLVNRYLAKRWAESVWLVRTLIANEIETGQSVQVGVMIRNAGRLSIPWLLVEDVISRRATHYPPKGLSVEGSPIRLVMLSPGKQLLLSYKLKAIRRGYYQIGPSVVETGDLFGLHRKYRVATQPQYLLVLPKLIPLVGYEIGSRRPIGEIRVSYRSMEDPTLMAGIRDYQMGDSLNRIHWRATARVGKLQTKVYQPTTMAGASLLLDLHSKSNPIQHEPNRTDLAVTAAASIAHAIYHMQQPFGIISNGRDAADRIRNEGWETDFRSRDALQEAMKDDNDESRLRPVILSADRGPEHFQNVYRTLARLERSHGLELSDLLLETQSRLRRDVSIIAIIQTLDDRNALALGLIARQGYSVTAIINTFEEADVQAIAGKLASYHIRSHHLRDEASISFICQHALFGVAARA